MSCKVRASNPELERFFFLTATVADRNLRPRHSRVEDLSGDSLEDPVTAEGGTESSEPAGREPDLSSALKRPGKANLTLKTCQRRLILQLTHLRERQTPQPSPGEATQNLQEADLGPKTHW